MGAVIVGFPELSDNDLVLDEQETKEVLKFFWPDRASKIDGLVAGNGLRRFAQQMLMAAIEASYAMGYLDKLTDVLAKRKPSMNLKKLGQKLAKKFAKHWWKHTKQQNLMDAEIYDTVRHALAYKYRLKIDEFAEGILAANRLSPFHIAKNTIVPVRWG
ncbi:hypothetical protein HNQ59_000430 [Chitinivorax tropicus]|uniref:Importin N-terminal domain-containing protein n=1 Tax=Chitinivorax tropicus TaxID=714531 RepID=A0A840MER0_9PROT|nr:hypothetical protein [Chitinivorax tropicus]MBB5017168.1 hypothetical protein [Chitinivorax tropicus]